MRYSNVILLLAFLIVSAGIVSAEIIEVPSERRTIQSAVNIAGRGDTVLVHPGVYEENIDFNGRDLTVGSLYLTTGEEAYIDSTIIDGNSDGPTVHFHRGESPDARLTGFTIRNGSGYDANGTTFGGGIHNWVDSSPTLDHLIIENCEADNGGGIYISATRENDTASEAVMVNTIVWNNSENNIYFSSSYETCTIEADYCDIEGGQDAVQNRNNGRLFWGEHNIDEDPEFEDPDGSRADIGCYPYVAQNALIYWHVYEFGSDDPLPEALSRTAGDNERRRFLADRTRLRREFWDHGIKIRL